jgi:two-component system chemotaxis response regulator CheB
MAQRDMVVIGASAGGLEMLLSVVAALPADLSAAVLVVLHIPAHTPTKLEQILARVSRLPVVSPNDGDAIMPGRIYVPVTDRHLLVEGNQVRLARGPKENRARPAVDVLFRSAAYFYGPRVIGIVLSGNLDDGTAGLWAIKDRGGIAIAQSPDEAQFPSMPQSAIEHVEVDYVLPVADMAATIARLVREPTMNVESNRNAENMGTEVQVALGKDALHVGMLDVGAASVLSCPDCHGVLMRIQEGTIVRYRCHTGHSYSSRALFDQMNREIDRNLWNALRSFDEQILLMRKMEEQARQANDHTQLSDWTARIVQSEKAREQLREMAMSAETVD